MDSHKLLFHPQRVADFISGKLIYPIEMEIGISGACNHRCIFCAVDYMEYQSRMLDADVLTKNLNILGKKGLKSIIYAGEGEPLVHPKVVQIINDTKKCGIDAAVSTNGVLFTEDKLKDCLKSLTWVRYSIAGASEETYKSIHQCGNGDLKKALSNMEAAVKTRKDQNLSVTLGAQLLLLPENKNEVASLAKKIREIGFDYFTVKPFSQHPQSKAKLQVDYSESEEIRKEIEQYQTDDFKIYFRSKSIENLGMEKTYHECYGLHFMTYMDSAGDVFPCIVFMGKNEFKYGNIYREDIDKIWESEHSQKLRATFKGCFLKESCRKNCRLDEINKYIEKIVYPDDHVNFI